MKHWKWNKLFKQAFWGAFKHKIQIISLILLTIILSTTITLTWITTRWLLDGETAMNSATTPFNYSYRFNSKNIPSIQSISPTFNICTAFSKSSLAESNTSKSIKDNSTPILTIAKDKNDPTGCLLPLISESLDITEKIASDNNITIENISFKNLLKWEKINTNSLAFKNSLFGQILHKKYHDIPNNEFKILYEQYTTLVEQYINPIFAFYLFNLYKANSDKLKYPKKTTDADYFDKVKAFKEIFLRDFVNARNGDSWIRDINNETDLSSDNVPIFGGGINIFQQLTKEDYEKRFPQATNFNNKAFFKQGFKGDLGNILMNINKDNNEIIFQLTNDHINDNKDSSYLDVAKYLTLPIGGTSLRNNWDISQAIWNHHNKLVGLLSNFNVNLRQEYLFSDFATNIRYRVISINPNNDAKKNNIKIISGTYPTGANQIVINPQFAEKYNYKIGDTLKIGSYKLIITGIGGDNFTSLPVVHPINFLPNPAKEAVLFVNHQLFIRDEFIRYSDIEDISNVYLTYTGNHIANDFELFRLFLNDNFKKNNNSIETVYQKMLAYNNNPQDIQKITEDLKITSTIENSDSNNYINRGFNSLPTITRTYTWFSIIIVIFMTMLTVFATVLIIRKTVERNATQIGVLKALGYENKTIIGSYWSYALITTILAVPIGWIVGSILQIAVMKIFENFFTIPNNIFYFDIIPFLIALAINIIVILITVTITAYKQVAKNTITLLRPNSDNKPSKAISGIHKRWFAFGSFKTRFRLALASVSYKKIIIMFVTILIASFTIAIALMIPAAVRSLDDSYYGLLKYQTNAEFQQPISNIPTTRYNLYPWKGIDAQNQSLDYPITEIRPVADYYKDAPANSWKKLSDNTQNINLDNILKQIAYNYYWTGGRGISLGWLEQISKDFNNNPKLSGLLSTIICPMVNTILTTNAEINTSDNWRTCTMNAIETAVPSYIKDFLNISGRKQRLTITHNTLPYNAKEDELYTYYDANLNNVAFKTLGVKPNSDMIALKESSKYIQEKKWLDKIPAVINRAMQIKHNLKVDSIFESEVQQKQLQYMSANNKWYPAHTSFWIYRDENNSENIYNMPLDKWSINDNNSPYGWTNHYGYKENDIGDDDIAKSYRNLNEIILRLPKEEITIDNIKYPAIKDEFLKEIINAKIPTNNNKFVIEQSSDNKWWHIRAFVPFATKNKFVDENFMTSALNLLNQSYDNPLWNIFIAILDGKTIGNKEIPKILKIDNTPIPQKVKYQVKAIHESYGELKVYINQRVANQILGFNATTSSEIYKKDPFNNEPLWFNGRLSSNPELTDVTSRYSTTSTLGDYSIASLNDNVANTVTNSELLTVKRELIKNLTTVASSIAAIFILGSISLSVIIVIMISNLLVHQFAKLMAIMKIQGYKYREINSLTLSMFIPAAIIGFIVGFISAWFIFQGILWTIGIFTGFIIPLYFQWWLLPITLATITIIYTLTYIISTETLKRMNVLELVKSSDE